MRQQQQQNPALECSMDLTDITRLPVAMACACWSVSPRSGATCMVCSVAACRYAGSDCKVSSWNDCTFANTSSRPNTTKEVRVCIILQRWRGGG